MSTLKQYLIFILVLAFILISSCLNADALYEIQTGNKDSASWEFTKHVSEYWQRKHILSDKPQKSRSYFVPKHVEGFSKRFKNLNNRECKLIIAPLKSISELPINEMQIKIAVVLWETYLAPIHLKGNGDSINMFDDQTWLIPEDSLIMPSYFNSLKASFQDSSADMNPKLVKFIQSTNWPPIQNKTINPETKNVDTNDSNPETFLEKSIDNNSTGYSAKLKIVERKSISTLITDGLDGQLLFEMIGPYKQLLDKAGDQYQILTLDDTFIKSLLKYNWFLERFSIPNLRVKTVGVTFALFVHENEDPEFVKDLITMLAQQPRTNFPKPYLMENLELNITKQISPLFLHQSSIEFFNID